MIQYLKKLRSQEQTFYFSSLGILLFILGLRLVVLRNKSKVLA